MNKAEEEFYEIAAYELAQKRPKPGIMAKAFSDSGGDERKTFALYIKLRVEQLAEEYREQIRREQREAKTQAAEAATAAPRARQAAREADEESRKITCPKCQHRGYRLHFTEFRGSHILFWLLLLSGVVPGIVYSRTAGDRLRCPECGGILQEKL